MRSEFYHIAHACASFEFNFFPFRLSSCAVAKCYLVVPRCTLTLFIFFSSYFLQMSRWCSWYFGTCSLLLYIVDIVLLVWKSVNFTCYSALSCVFKFFKSQWSNFEIPVVNCQNLNLSEIPVVPKVKLQISVVNLWNPSGQIVVPKVKLQIPVVKLWNANGQLVKSQFKC